MTIKQIQLLLLYLGYDPGEPDGLWGAKTKAAVEQFQGDYGLTVDGDPGAATKKMLRGAVAGTADKVAQSSAAAPKAEKTGTFWDEIEYFRKSEFACKCGCGTDGIKEPLVRAVDEIRRKLGAPVTINSGIRCAVHNANVGGVSNSQHLYGTAADLSCSLSPAKMQEVAEEIIGDKGGIGLYSWGIHVDTRGTRARWTG